MRWTALFIPTLREDPAEAKNAIHRLLIRAGYMRRQDYLFLGARVLRKLAAMVREEMDAIGAQEILTSSPRGMREIAGELRSYKQLPQIWYEFDGFTVCCWSFGDPESRAAKAFHRVFDRCAVHYSASAGALVAPSQNGDSKALEWAESRPQPPAIPDPEGDLSPEEFPTPGQKTIADLSAFTGLPETSQMKSVVMVFDQKPVLVMLRGDHQLSEAKLRLELCAKDLRPANAQEIREWLGADAGSLGPVGVRNMPILADEALRGRRNLACGANRNEYHLRHVTPGEDFSPEYLDLRMAASGDPSNLEGGALPIEPAITLGRMRPGSRLHGLSVTDESGNQREVAAGAAESFLEHIVNAAVEQHHDGDGLALAASIAPFAIVLTPVSNDEAQQRTARELYDALRAAGIDALLDDRDERPGVKFKDADLIGIPYRVTVGKKLAQGMVEVRDRRARTSEDVAVTETVSFLTDKLK